MQCALCFLTSQCRPMSPCMVLFVYLFVLGFYRVTQEFFTHIETSPLPLKGSKFGICSASMAIEVWGFFNVPNLLWQRVSVNNGHLLGPVTLTPVEERLALYGGVTTCVYSVHLSWLGFEQPTVCLRGESSNPLRHRGDSLHRRQKYPTSWIVSNTNKVRIKYLSNGYER